MSEDVSPPAFRFSSPEGIKLCRDIAKEKLGFDPHDYVVSGVCKALDGSDLLAITPTGSGKTSFLIVYLLVIVKITTEPGVRSPNTPRLATKFPKNPMMVVVCPTKSLEHDMVSLKVNIRCDAFSLVHLGAEVP